MLLKFKVKNYKSFVEETVLSMVAAPKQKGLDYSLLPIKTKEKGKTKPKSVNGLCSSVIYGPNASGKTNIIGAMEVMRSIVLRGNIRNPEKQSSLNAATFLLETIPNNLNTDIQPVELSVEFFQDGLLIDYTLALDLGSFFDKHYKRKIIKERLTVNGMTVFSRENLSLSVDGLDIIKDYLSDKIKQKNEIEVNKNAVDIAENSLHSEELFLTNGFKVVFSSSLVKVILDWFTDKFRIVYRADSVMFGMNPENFSENGLYADKTINEAIKLFGANSNSVAYKISKEESYPELYSIFMNAETQKINAIKSEAIESYGTIRFANIFPLVMDSIMTGSTLAIDEFDASIHPMAIMSVINVFHNDDINKKGAQLIFNTHNPIFLNSNLFRRDEIKFVERDDETHLSTLYSLSDFKTAGKTGVRKHGDYMKNYFVSQYGAIKDVDFTPIFEEQLSIDDKEMRHG